MQRYRQQLAQGSFQLKSIYYSSNPDLATQQQALLLALDTLPQPIWMREAQVLASQNIYLPDNHLLFHLLQRTGEPALYSMLWRRPADQDALRALSTINRFHHGSAASDLLIAASGNEGLKGAALRQFERALALAAASPEIPAGGTLQPSIRGAGGRSVDGGGRAPAALCAGQTPRPA